jgi:outer membrane protein TolC
MSCVSALLVAVPLSGCALTPVPVEPEFVAATVARDRASIYDAMEPLGPTLSLEEAIARALTHNLDHRVKLMEEAIALGQTDLDKFDLLPKVAANAGYFLRDKDYLSTSKDTATGVVSAQPSQSLDRSRRTFDLTASWNVLDFGIYYFNARQNADRALIAGERRRKAAQNILQEVASAYWRTAAAQSLAGELSATRRMAEGAIGDARNAERDAMRSPVDALRQQRALLENLRQLEAIEQQFASAQIELATLINVPPGSRLKLAPLRRLAAPAWKMSMPTLEVMALANSPDLRENLYQSRIAADETRKAIVRMIPGLSLTAGPSYDSNSFLVHNQWTELSTRLSANLVAIASAPQVMAQNEASETLVETRRLALHVAILAQAHVAVRQFEMSRKQFARAGQIADVERRLYQLSSARSDTDMQSKIEQVAARTSVLYSEFRHLETFSQMQTALARVRATAGQDILPPEGTASDLPELTRSIRGVLTTWETGAVPQTAEPRTTASIPSRDDGSAAVADRRPQ